MQVERGYRYNLMPFVEIRRFWKYRDQLGNFAVFSNIFGNVSAFCHGALYFPLFSEGWTVFFLFSYQDFY